MAHVVVRRHLVVDRRRRPGLRAARGSDRHRRLPHPGLERRRGPRAVGFTPSNRLRRVRTYFSVVTRQAPTPRTHPWFAPEGPRFAGRERYRGRLCSHRPRSTCKLIKGLVKGAVVAKVIQVAQPSSPSRRTSARSEKASARSSRRRPVAAESRPDSAGDRERRAVPGPVTRTVPPMERREAKLLEAFVRARTAELTDESPRAAHADCSVPTTSRPGGPNGAPDPPVRTRQPGFPLSPTPVA